MSLLYGNNHAIQPRQKPGEYPWQMHNGSNKFYERVAQFQAQSQSAHALRNCTMSL
jgi:hypothetical protein